MAAEYVTAREFDTWREGHDNRVEHIVSLLEKHHALDLTNENRITTLETHRKHAIWATGVFVTLLAAVVGAVAASLVGG